MGWLAAWVAIPVAAESAGEFENAVKPFFREHCVRCHGPKKAKGKLMLDKLSGNLAHPSEREVWRAILDQLDSGEMPPDDEPQPPASGRDALAAWIRSEAARTAAAFAAASQDDHHYPEDGNRIDHEILFSGEVTAKAASPARLWRLRPSLYKAQIGRLSQREFGKTLQGDSFSPPWGLISTEGIKDYAALYRVDEPETELLINNARSVARRMLGSSGRGGGRPGRMGKGKGTRSAQNRVRAGSGAASGPASLIDKAAALVLQRELDSEERKRYLQLCEEAIEEFGAPTGTEIGIAAVLLHPKSVFRFELGGGEMDAHGRIHLTAQETALAIAYSLTDEAPDEALLATAQAGKLGTAEEIREQVRRILARPEVAKSQQLRFFRQYFGYENAPEIFKDDDTKRAAGIGGYNPKSLVSDTDHLVLHILEKDRNVLAEMLTTSESFISTGGPLDYWHKGKEALAKRAVRQGNVALQHTVFADRRNKVYQHYNFDPALWTEDMPFDLPENERAGILTQPSWLIAHSTNFENHAILRGKWIRERLLGGIIPDTPITVDAQLPDDDTLTLRKKMRVTREAFCWKCHEQMDPLGFPFETFDHFGRYRTSELDQPVDASGVLAGAGDPALDGEVTGALDLLERLARSDRARQVFVRHVFRFFLGRNEMLSDSATLIAADRAYVDSGGSMKALIEELLASDSFRYRFVDTPPLTGTPESNR